MEEYIQKFKKFTKLNESIFDLLSAGRAANTLKKVGKEMSGKSELKDKIKNDEVKYAILSTLGYFKMKHTQNLGAIGRFLMDEPNNNIGAGTRANNITGMIDLIKGTQYEKMFDEWLNALNDLWRKKLPEDIDILDLKGRPINDIKVDLVHELELKNPDLYRAVGYYDEPLTAKDPISPKGSGKPYVGGDYRDW